MLPGPLDVTETGERVEALETALNDDPRPLSSSIPSYCSKDNITFAILQKHIYIAKYYKYISQYSSTVIC